jgi:hypothetical protein
LKQLQHLGPLKVELPLLGLELLLPLPLVPLLPFQALPSYHPSLSCHLSCLRSS